MVKHGIKISFCKKKGLIPTRALIFLVVAILVVLTFIFIILDFKNKIFG